MFSKKVREEDIHWPIELPNVELISVHIEKTAGTSFFHQLKEIYQEEYVVRIDTHKHQKLAVDQAFQFPIQKLKKAKVIHGHFRKADLEKYFLLPKHFRLITWLRDPAERILSGYNHLSGILDKYVDRERSPDLLKKMKRSFQEYIQIEENSNRISHYLEGWIAEDFDFIGFTESYNEGIENLCELLKKPKPSAIFHNSSQSYQSEISTAEMEIIKRLNAEDFILYSQAKEIFDKRS
jgi:hypothetical protein